MTLMLSGTIWLMAFISIMTLILGENKLRKMFCEDESGHHKKKSATIEIKSYLHFFFILIIISGCNNKDIEINIDSPYKDKGPLKEKFKTEADSLNSGIKNAKATLDKNKGLLTITFDYPDQRWSLGRNLGNDLWFEPPLSFEIHLYDKNGQLLEEFPTKQLFFPKEALELIKKNPKWTPIGWQGLTTNCLDKCQISVRDNILVYPITATVIDHVSKILLGFETKKYTHDDNLWTVDQGTRKNKK